MKNMSANLRAWQIKHKLEGRFSQFHKIKITYNPFFDIEALESYCSASRKHNIFARICTRILLP